MTARSAAPPGEPLDREAALRRKVRSVITERFADHADVDVREDAVADLIAALAPLLPATGGGATLIGRDDFLVEKVAKALHGEADRKYPHTGLRHCHRGRWFEVIVGDDRIVRVTVVLDRVEQVTLDDEH